MIYLCNAFSLLMLDERVEFYHVPCRLDIQRIGPKDVRRILERNPDYFSAYGHQRTAPALERLLGMRVCVNRKTIRLTEKDRLIVAQVVNMKNVYVGIDDEPFFVFHLIRLLRYEKTRRDEDV